MLCCAVLCCAVTLYICRCPAAVAAAAVASHCWESGCTALGMRLSGVVRWHILQEISAQAAGWRCHDGGHRQKLMTAGQVVNAAVHIEDCVN